jgi:hypothetical protein
MKIYFILYLYVKLPLQLYVYLLLKYVIYYKNKDQVLHDLFF